jgi:hypothetical protein
MRRGYPLLALGLVLLCGPAGRAGEIGWAQLTLNTAPAPASTDAAAPAAVPAPAAVSAPAGAPCCASCACCTGCASCERFPRLRNAAARVAGYNMADHLHGNGECWQHLCNWLTYCPPKAACHFGCCGCGCKQCTPCCTPVYMYFVDRCDCTLGYRGAPPHPPLAAPGPEHGPDAGPAAGPAVTGR